MLLLRLAASRSALLWFSQGAHRLPLTVLLSLLTIIAPAFAFFELLTHSDTSSSVENCHSDAGGGRALAR
jgi:hypothetical protein